MSSVKVLFILAVALTFKCVFSTSWFSKDVYSATSSITPTQNNLIGIIDQSDIMTFSMDITINSFPDNQWSSIFHFGNNNTTRLPGIWLYNNTLGLHICISNKNTWNDCENVQISNNNLLETGTKYSLKILYTQSSLVISINGVNYFVNSNYPSHTVLTDQAIYAGNPWWPSANVLIENLKIKIPADLCGGYAPQAFSNDIEGGLFAYSGSYNGAPYYQNVGGSSGGRGYYIYYSNNEKKWKWYDSLISLATGYDWTVNNQVDTGLGATWYYPMKISAKVCGQCDSNPTQNNLSN